MRRHDPRWALLDLDSSLADYASAMQAQMRLLQAPGEAPYMGRDPSERELPHLEARRKLIQRVSGFWRNLKRIEAGFALVEVMRQVGFPLHVLTKGPASAPNAWSEKLEWAQEHLPGAAVTLSDDKSMVYGRVLYDDFAPYFEPWLQHRPRGLVICLAQPWNADYAPGGPKARPQVLRYDGSNLAEARARLELAYNRP